MQGLHIHLIRYGLIEVLKYVVMCSGLVRWPCIVELHLCSVAMTTGVLACERALGGGMMWPANLIPLGQGEPFSGIRPHELSPEGGTGPESIDFKGTILIFIHSSFSQSRTLQALWGWTLRIKTTAVTTKTILRNLMMILDGLSKQEMIR